MGNCCYVYKWTHIPSLRWYVGSRTAKNSHPNDGYICSSVYVKPLIINNPDDWHREIIEIGSAQEMRDLEQEILQTFNAAQDIRSFNQSNNGIPKNWGIPWNKGIKTGPNPEHSERMKGKPGPWLGKKRGPAWNKGQTGDQHHNYGKKYNIVKKHKHTEEFKEQARMRILKNNPMFLKFNCPHCEYIGPKSRWHWDKCRSKALEGGK
jgi:hypothetical protein